MRASLKSIRMLFQNTGRESSWSSLGIFLMSFVLMKIIIEVDIN